MAYTNKIIYNPYNKQEIKFLQTGKNTGGKLLEMEATYSAPGNEPAPHYHPIQEEFFKVIAGEVNVRINGNVKVLQAGDELHIPANTVHCMWNTHTGKTVVNWIVKPALQTEYFLETAYGLAADGQINKKGMPSVLQSAVMMRTFSNTFRLAKPPYIVQKILFGLLSPFAYLAGYQATYRHYLN
ncbi:cupin domain-containing protein [Mucilaginibacter terrigena]|uniref:Cupin domain-containing protein n=1 Tax=Mucilaginibacter terrigena TaxID=2492395 RepID=A0A4Q5LJU6_9SPHI|nr:cupin domain-containing protein [Mucilaginibacter terrigena]RYU89623.1 cupin domain-containing protein [Mucilaginibacter terrigena]